MFEAQTEIKNTIIVNTSELLSERKAEESKHAPMLRTRGKVWFLLDWSLFCLLLAEARHECYFFDGGDLCFLDVNFCEFTGSALLKATPTQSSVEFIHDANFFPIEHIGNGVCETWWKITSLILRHADFLSWWHQMLRFTSVNVYLKCLSKNSLWTMSQDPSIFIQIILQSSWFFVNDELLLGDMLLCQTASLSWMNISNNHEPRILGYLWYNHF